MRETFHDTDASGYKASYTGIRHCSGTVVHICLEKVCCQYLSELSVSLLEPFCDIEHAALYLLVVSRHVLGSLVRQVHVGLVERQLCVNIGNRSIGRYLPVQLPVGLRRELHGEHWYVPLSREVVVPPTDCHGMREVVLEPKLASTAASYASQVRFDAKERVHVAHHRANLYAASGILHAYLHGAPLEVGNLYGRIRVRVQLRYVRIFARIAEHFLFQLDAALQFVSVACKEMAREAAELEAS